MQSAGYAKKNTKKFIFKTIFQFFHSLIWTRIANALQRKFCKQFQNRKKYMSVKFFSAVLLLGSAFMLGADAYAEERPQPPRRNMRPGNMMRQGMNYEMMLIRFARKELAAYKANPTAENYAALEKAVQKFFDTRKENLEKQLADLEKDRKSTSESFLKKVKSGELKMPGNQRRNGRPGQRGPRNRQRGNPPAGK